MTAQPQAKTVPATVRKIEPQDNPAIASIIRSVLTEFGCTGEGFAIHDPEVDRMYETYTHDGARSAYFIIEKDGKVVGGGGVAPLKGTYQNICELQKFYILPEHRGQGYGYQLLDRCLSHARAQQFKRCYIETVSKMDMAAALYKKLGFEAIGMPLGNTGHHACDRWYVRSLNG